MVIALYLIACVLEVVGIAVVVVDVWIDRRRARGLLENNAPTYVPNPPGPRAWIYEQIDESAIRRDPEGIQASMIVRRRREREQRELQRVALGGARAYDELLGAVADMLRGNLFRRLVGPAMLVAGVIVGTVANVVAQ
jgi:hypothetical protein